MMMFFVVITEMVLLAAAVDNDCDNAKSLLSLIDESVSGRAFFKIVNTAMVRNCITENEN